MTLLGLPLNITSPSFQDTRLMIIVLNTFFAGIFIRPFSNSDRHVRCYGDLLYEKTANTNSVVKFEQCLTGFSRCHHWGQFSDFLHDDRKFVPRL